MNEDILKQALEQTLDESYNEMIDQDIPDYDFSPEFKAKMNGLILSQQTQTEHKRSKAIWFTAMAAAAALLCVTIGLSANTKPSRSHNYTPEIVSEDPVSSTSADTSAKASDSTTAAVTSSVGTSEKQTASETSTAVTTAVKKQTSSSAASLITQTSTSHSAPTVNTSASSAAVSASVTNTTVSAAVTATDITVTTDITEIMPDERSFSMKKISAFLAAFLTAQSTAIPHVNANSEITDIPVSPFISYNINYYINDSLQDKFREYRADESVLDINKDGQFDLKDVYICYRMAETPDQIKPDKHIIMDIDGDGINSADDITALMYYYATYNDITKDQLAKEYYFDAMGDLEIDSVSSNLSIQYLNAGSFIRTLTENANQIFRLYNIFQEITDEKGITFDLDGNGNTEIADILDYSIFELYYKQDGVGADHEDYPDDPPFLYVNEETYYRCQSLMEQYNIEDTAPVRGQLTAYMLRKFLDENGYKLEYSMNSYFDSLRKDKALVSHFSDLLDSYQCSIGFGSGDMRFNNICAPWEDDIREKEYSDFCKRAADDPSVVPDLNSDGKLDIADYRLADLFFDEYRIGDYIPQPLEYRDTFNKTMDINGNGVVGDLNDIICYQMYIAEKNGYTSDKCHAEIMKYYIEHPDFDPEHAGIYTSYAYGFESSKTYEQYLAEIEAGTNVIPDINNDGKADIADYAQAEIAQWEKAYRNKSRSSIVPDSVKSYYLNECDIDKDGYCGTFADLELIECYVADSLGIDYTDREHLHESLEVYIEEYISQFDDQLPEGEKTIKASFDKKLTEGFSIAQLQLIAHDTDGQQYVYEHADELTANITDKQKEILDLNSNGDIDSEDYIIAKTLYNNYFLDKNEAHKFYNVITEEYMNRFYNNFDLNKNGLNGDFTDLEMAELFYKKLLNSEFIEVDYYNDCIRRNQEEKEKLRSMSNEELNEWYENKLQRYIKDIEYGVKCEPDINWDNTVDINDLFYAYVGTEILNNNGNINDTDFMTYDQFSNYQNSFDVDNDGFSGTEYDFELIKRYIAKHTNMSFEETERRLDKFAKQHSDIFKHPTETTDERNGDANVDRSVNIADSVAIMQAYINPDKYALTDEGSFNADISNTGDGVTPKDAQLIQQKLLKL